MKKFPQALRALMAVFPTYESWLLFREAEENAHVIETLINFGKTQGILSSGTKNELESLIHQFPGLKKLNPSTCLLTSVTCWRDGKNFLI